eukprot:GHVU01215226.1.p3 GENE.GHVU01215226.1~~GHVU01215226.1.p3  ORF type:complete len:199 (-),score=32.64 GHVU01215226.1:115-711(-)
MWKVPEALRQQVLGAILFNRAFVKPSDAPVGSGSDSSATFPEDPMKQRRYELFCAAVEGKIAVREATDAYISMDAESADKEKKEFGAAYSRFRASLPAGSDASAVPDIKRELPTRTTWNWRTPKVLLKKLQLPDPWAKKVCGYVAVCRCGHLLAVCPSAGVCVCICVCVCACLDGPADLRRRPAGGKGVHAGQTHSLR